MLNWHRGLRFIPPLVSPATSTRPHRAANAAGLCEAIRQTTEERCHRFVGDSIKQLLDTAAPDPRNDAKPSAMSSDRIDHRGLLSNKQVPRAMKYQTTLLFWCFGRHKPHVGPADRLAYRLGISGIVLLSFDVWLHIGRRH